MMRLLIGVVGVLMSGAWSVSVVTAQEDQAEFRMRVFGNTDTATPTAPVLLTGTSTAPSQIDLTWSTSTDNFAVSGYTVIRDGSVVATTSQLLFSDTGLVASTTYTYQIRAFDPALNYSTSSNALAITTLSPPPPPPVATTSAGQVDRAAATAARAVLDDLQVQPGMSTTGLQVRTARPARLEIRWGRTGAYELGYLVRSSFSREHPLLITDLEPGTRYEYEIIAATPYGNARVIASGDFTTLSPPSSALPGNVEDFQAETLGADVRLSWSFPADLPAGSQVRVLRSHLGFPLHSQDGALVYQGTGQEVLDRAILRQYSPVYYTAFVLMPDGAISSGAVTLAYASAGDATEQAGAPAGNEEAISDPLLSTPPMLDQATSSRAVSLPADTLLPEPYEVTVTQNAYQGTMEMAPLQLYTHTPFVVSVPSDRVAENLKTIFATLVNPTDTRETSSFLLRLNRDGTAYTATVPAPVVQGSSQLLVQIMDYEAAVVARYQTPVSFSVKEDQGGMSFMTSRSGQLLGGLSLGLGLASVMGGLWWLVALRRQRR